MTCYQRHLGPLFEALGLSYDATDRSRVDAAIREVLGLTDAEHCPQVWAAIKALSPEERDALAGRIAAVLRSLRRFAR